jgi:FkbH-like protein
MKLIEALGIIPKRPNLDKEPLLVALVCGFTPLHMETFLHAELQLLFPERRIELTTGIYGDVFGTLQGLKGRRFDAAVLALEWSDLDARLGLRQLGGWGPKHLDSVVERVDLWLAQLEPLLAEICQSIPVVISLPTLPLPPLFFTPGWRSSLYELKLKELLAAFASALVHHSRVHLVSEQRLNQVSPPAGRLSVKSDWTTGFPYQLPHASALAALLALLVKNPWPKKGLITDLDNTLWSGIVGEVGAEGVHWDLDHHSQTHGVYQQMLRTLADEGVLLAVASKNDPGMVEAAFRRSDLLLTKECIFPFAVSWGSKAKAVAEILETWNVGPESVVFVDDNPLELAEVKALHPQVECLMFSQGEPQAVYELLGQLRDYFGRAALSEEDALRLDSIRSTAGFRQQIQENEGFSEQLLEQAKAELTVNFRKDSKDQRALELLNKTNQFNLNGQRFTEVAWQDYLSQPDTFMLTVSYKDRFGALGKIAVMAGRINSESLHVDAWVMSCRAFARRVEHQCLRLLFARFKLDQITFAYEATPRNGPLTSFMRELLSESVATESRLTRSSFTTKCPKLFHRVMEDNHE